jgi:hypothetical protein
LIQWDFPGLIGHNSVARRNMSAQATKGRTPKVLVVTIAIGERFRSVHRPLFLPSQQEYCRRHGYDFVVVDDFIDRTEFDRRLITLQKALVCHLAVASNYEYVVFIDADILINVARAPPISITFDDSGLVGIVDEYSQPSSEQRLLIQRAKHWETSAKDYYRLCGFDLQTHSVLNTGVMVFQPSIHRPMLEQIYAHGKRSGRDHARGSHFEQTLIGFVLQKFGRYRVLQNRWNALFALHLMQHRLTRGSANGTDPKTKETLLREFHADNFFVHFAGGVYRGVERAIDRMNAGLPHAAT